MPRDQRAQQVHPWQQEQPLAQVRIACSYARNSKQDSDGIAVQHEINRKAAARDGYVIPDALLVSDDHTTGVSTSREGFDRLLALVEAGSPPFEAVYVRNKKRLGRWDDSGMHDYLRILFAKAGVAIRYAEGANPDYSGGMNPAVAVESLYDRLETIDASTERSETRARIITGVRRRILQGFWPAASIPYATRRWLADLLTGCLIRVVNEKDGSRQRGCGFKLAWLQDGSFKAVQQIFEWVEEEHLGPMEIVRRLIELRLPPAVRPNRRSRHSRNAPDITSEDWTPPGVEYVLRNRLYCGQLLWPRSASLEEAVSHLEANLDDETPILHTQFMADPPVPVERFEAVQEILRGGRRRGSPSTPAVRPLLSGIVRCWHCNAPWYGHRGRYYRHDKEDEGTDGEGAADCVHLNRYVRIGSMNSAVLDRVLPVLEADWFTEGLADQLHARLECLNEDEQGDQLRHLRLRLEDLNDEINGVIRDQGKQKDPDLLENYGEVLDSLKLQRRTVREEIAVLETRKRSAREAISSQDHLVRNARNMLAVYRTLPKEQKKTILSGIIECVRFDPDSWHAEVRLKLSP
jgi:hypothetical protein